MMRIESLAFRGDTEARAALERLRKGTDLAWMRDHADGRVGADDGTVLRLRGDLVTTAALPEGVRKAVGGARAGDLRLYGEPGGPFHVLSIRQVIEAAPQPFEAVKGEIATRVFVERRQKALDDWAARLRAASDVRILVTDRALADLLGLGSAGGA